MNFFNNRVTNASAECFNARLKKFRAYVRGENDVVSSYVGWQTSMASKGIEQLLFTTLAGEPYSCNLEDEFYLIIDE